MPQLPQPEPLTTETHITHVTNFQFLGVDGGGYFRISLDADDEGLGVMLTLPNATAIRVQDRDISAIVEGLQTYLAWRQSLD